MDKKRHCLFFNFYIQSVSQIIIENAGRDNTRQKLKTLQKNNFWSVIAVRIFVLNMSDYSDPTNLPFFALAGNFVFTTFLDCISLKTFNASST